MYRRVNTDLGLWFTIKYVNRTSLPGTLDAVRSREDPRLGQDGAATDVVPLAAAQVLQRDLVRVVRDGRILTVDDPRQGVTWRTIHVIILNNGNFKKTFSSS